MGSPTCPDDLIRQFIADIEFDIPKRDAFFGPPGSPKTQKEKFEYLSTHSTYGALDVQEIGALSRLERRDLGIIKIGRPPGSALRSIEFTILSI